MLFQFPILADLNILVVENDLDNSDLLAFALEYEGAKVTTVKTAEEALDILEQVRFDVLLSDIVLSNKDGCSLIKSWRQREAELGISSIPAIAITALVQDQDKQDALAAGFDLHLSKPVDIDEIAQIIIDLISSKAKVVK